MRGTRLKASESQEDQRTRLEELGDCSVVRSGDEVDAQIQAGQICRRESQFVDPCAAQCEAAMFSRFDGARPAQDFSTYS